MADNASIFSPSKSGIYDMSASFVANPDGATYYRIWNESEQRWQIGPYGEEAPVSVGAVEPFQELVQRPLPILLAYEA